MSRTGGSIIRSSRGVSAGGAGGARCAPALELRAVSTGGARSSSALLSHWQFAHPPPPPPPPPRGEQQSPVSFTDTRALQTKQKLRLEKM
ncbi:hypothetical protein JYU34_016730 [Plutella xylostella]|uniref:Uncharacterized protein n=1 Tax=Plutella xylostella TaxID=51655 RepID=A0ABQ7Q4Q8_PLUXY|nr:hypothetical protein JYU34_016730 [Plutella xylostella]